MWANVTPALGARKAKGPKSQPGLRRERRRANHRVPPEIPRRRRALPIATELLRSQEQSVRMIRFAPVAGEGARSNGKGGTVTGRVNVYAQ